MASRTFAVRGADGQFLVLNTGDIVDIGKRLRDISYPLQREFRAKLREAAHITVLRAQAIVREMPSNSDGGVTTEIANDIKVKLLRTGIKITVGDSQLQGSALALSGLLELGQGGWSRQKFRHPLFDIQGAPWYDQPTHPYLKPAVEETYPAFEEAVVAAVEEAKARLDLGGDE